MQYGREFMRAVDSRHAAHNYEMNFWTLTKEMKIPVVEGAFNSAVYLREPLITLHPDFFHSDWTFTQFHELAHHILRESGIEAQLWHDAESPEQFHCWVEAYCNFGALQLQTPNPVLKSLLRMYGYTPGTIVALTSFAGIDLFDAMQRVTFGFLDDDADRTCLLTQGSYLRKVVTTNEFPDFAEGQRVPEIALIAPDAKLLLLPERFGKSRTLGMISH